MILPLQMFPFSGYCDTTQTKGSVDTPNTGE